MKYLKLFENIYYQRANKNDFFKDVPFNGNELDLIKNYLDKKENFKDTYWISMYNVSRRGFSIKNGYVYQLMNRNILLAFLEKSEDEWYYLSIVDKYSRDVSILYKCDQIEGLIKLIEDKIIE